MALLSRAALSDGKGNFIIDEIAINEPSGDEIIVQMKAAGICHTDYDSLRWGKPMVMGHEGAGIVYRIGKSIRGIKPGDAVILNWATPCDHCFQCIEGNQSLCENNSPVIAGGNGYTPGHANLEGTLWKGQPVEKVFNLGTFSEYVLVKSSAVVLNPSAGMSFPAASIIGCGVMTGYGSVVNVAKVQPGSSVVVLGCGGVGLNVVQSAKVAGASQIIAIDINPGRLEMAVRFGAGHTILAAQTDRGLLEATEKVKALTGGRGADYAFECTARPELGAAPLAMVRNAGTAVQVSGIEEKISFDMRLFEWDKVYVNPLYGKSRPQIDFPKIAALYDTGNLLLEEMVTQTYPLHELEKAFTDMLQGQNAKGVIVL